MIDNSNNKNQPSSTQNFLKPFQTRQNIQKAGKVGKSHHEFFRVMNEQKNEINYRKISIQELSKHKSKQSAWLSLDGVVYDVTVYLNYHPGGVILLEGCGRQCMNTFNQYHPWVNAKYLLEKYRIGYLSR